MEQVKWIDLDGGGIYDGILTDEGDLICKDCGHKFKASDRYELWDIVRVYDSYMDFVNELAEYCLNKKGEEK